MIRSTALLDRTAPAAARRLGAVVLLLGTTACAGSADPPLVRVVARAGGFVAPDSVPTGLVRVRLVNADSAWHEAALARLTSHDASLTRFLAEVGAGNEYPGFATDVGGPTLVAPGDSLDVLLRLAPARYLVLSWRHDDVLRGFAVELVAVERRNAAVPPRADDVPLTDFAIAPVAPRAGAGVLHVVNRGPSVHELTLLRLAPGRSADDYLAWREGGEAGPAPARAVAGTAALGAGAEAWLEVRWEPGDYLLTCAVETLGAHPVPRHYTLGMQQRVTISR